MKIDLVDQRENAATTENNVPVVSPNMNIRELQAFLNISRSQAYELVNNPDFPSFRIGTKILINRDRLEKWIDQQVSCYQKEKKASAFYRR